MSSKPLRGDITSHRLEVPWNLPISYHFRSSSSECGMTMFSEHSICYALEMKPLGGADAKTELTIQKSCFYRHWSLSISLGLPQNERSCVHGLRLVADTLSTDKA